VGFKLLGRNEENVENEIKIVKAINKDVNMNFGIEKCARICFKKVESIAKYILASRLRRTLKNWT
jgi:adenosine deaminase